MKKYQIVVLRSLKGFGQFVTESRDEVNTYEFADNDERPVIFGEKLKAVERRTVMRKVREVLRVRCWLTTSKKGGDGGISGLCMSCPACALFGGTYAPKKGGGTVKNAIEMRRVFYTAAFPFKGGGIRDVTFNAVDERTGQTGRALGTNQIIEPRDFIDVVTVEADDENWVKLSIWGIEHSDRYGANTRIYGEVHNTVVGIVQDTRLRLAAIDLAHCKDAESVKKTIADQKLTFRAITCEDSEKNPEIETVIKELAKSPEVEDLAHRKNRVDLSVKDYFKMVAEKWDRQLLEIEDKSKKKEWEQWNEETRLEKLRPSQLSPQQLILAQELAGQTEGPKATSENCLKFLRTQFGVARLIESVIAPSEQEEEVA